MLYDGLNFVKRIIFLRRPSLSPSLRRVCGHKYLQNSLPNAFDKCSSNIDFMLSLDSSF